MKTASSLARAVLWVMAAALPCSGSGSGDLLLRVYGTPDWPPPWQPRTLSYDDGTACWLTWAGVCRGVWFDGTDFEPTSPGIECQNTQYWFYHHESYPWDTASFYGELWNGDWTGPVEQLDQTSKMAMHYMPVYCVYAPSIRPDVDFWVLVNTSMSSGGWPSTLCDDGPNFTGQNHSFFSDDFVIWEPWTSDAAGASPLMALEADSWGGIKGLFRSS